MATFWPTLGNLGYFLHLTSGHTDCNFKHFYFIFLLVLFALCVPHQIVVVVAGAGIQEEVVAVVGLNQCDQMARRFFNIWSFTTMNMCPKNKILHILPRFKLLPNTK